MKSLKIGSVELRSLPLKDGRDVLLVRLAAEGGIDGVGLAVSLLPGRVVSELFQRLFTPLLSGADAACHEALFASARQAAAGIGWSGSAAYAYSAADLALWDLKAKSAGLTVARLLGGARIEAPAFRSGINHQASGLKVRPRGEMAGLLIDVDGRDPEADAACIQEARESCGDSAWLGVRANGCYDLDTALGIGHFLEEDIGADWFEDPLPPSDGAGYQRLSERLDVPLAVGATFSEPHEFLPWLRSGQVRVIRPDVARLGGVTPFLRVAAMAELHHVAVAPVRLPEVGVHLACGLPGVRAVEQVDWLDPLLREPLTVRGGRLAAPERPGWGWEIDPDAVARFSSADE